MNSRRSQVIQAILWIAFQYGHHDKIALCAYSWRAALLLGNCVYRLPCSSSTLFGVDSVKNNRVRKGTEDAMLTAGQLLKGKKLIIVDEAYTWSLEHFEATNRSWNSHFGGDITKLFDGIQVAFYGDPLQHNPPGVNNSPLYKYANLATDPVEEQVGVAGGEDKTGRSHARALAGRKLYEQATEAVFTFTKQHRLDAADPSGAELFKFSRLFMSDTVTRGQIVEFCEAVNKKAVTSLTDLVDLNPHVAILRHRVRQAINLELVKVGPLISRCPHHYFWSPAWADHPALFCGV